MIPYYFYRELFPKGELDAEGEFNKGKYTAIAVRIFEEGNKVHRYTVCDDLALVDRLCCCNDFCVMAPVSFAGKSQRQSKCQKPLCDRFRSLMAFLKLRTVDLRAW